VNIQTNVFCTFHYRCSLLLKGQRQKLNPKGRPFIMRNTYCDKWQQKACLKVMKKKQVVDQTLSQLRDFPLLCAHSGKF
jgi:hypothetical protein